MNFKCFKLKNTFLVIFSLSLWVSCSKSKKVYKVSGETMGTTFTVKIAALQKPPLPSLKLKIDSVLKEVNRQMSTYDRNSEISMVNRSPSGEGVKVSDWFFEVLKYSLNLAQETKGFFDPTLGPLVNLWGFGPEGTRRRPKKKDLYALRAYVGYEKVLLSEPSDQKIVKKTHSKVYLDLSATAKGFAVDKVSELLTQEKFRNHLVEVGGEMRAKGDVFKKPWRVAVEKPNEKKRSVQAVLDLQDMSIATSGSYRNFFREKGKSYSHTINYKTGEPIRHQMLSVSVLDPSCMKADGLATALMAMGPDRAWEFSQKHKMSVYFIFKNDKTEKVETRVTDGFARYLRK